MTDALDRLTTALADRYRIERELGQGGMARRSVARATPRQVSLKRRQANVAGHFSDISRAAALAGVRQTSADA